MGVTGMVFVGMWGYFGSSVVAAPLVLVKGTLGIHFLLQQANLG